MNTTRITKGNETIDFTRLGKDSFEITGSGFPQPVYTDRATAERTFEGRLRYMGWQRA
jgi:hypothetical protein